MVAVLVANNLLSVGPFEGTSKDTGSLLIGKFRLIYLPHHSLFQPPTSVKSDLNWLPTFNLLRFPVQKLALKYCAITINSAQE